MAKYYYEIHCANGEILDSREDDEFFSTESEAYDAGMEAMSNMHYGAELSNLSNPGDYPLRDDENDDEVIVCEVE